MTRARNRKANRMFSSAALRQARAEAGMRREDLACHAGVSIASLISYEVRGTVPGANNLVRIADALRIPIDDLFI